MEINRVLHNVLVSCALASVTVLSITASIFLIKWAKPAKYVEEIAQNLNEKRRPDDPNLEDTAPIVRIVNNVDRMIDHLQRGREPDTPEDDQIPVVNIVNGVNRIVDHLQRDRDPNSPNVEHIPVVNAVNDIQDITQAVAHPMSSTGSGLSRGVRWVGRGIGKGAKCVGRGIGGIWNYFFGGNSDEYDETVDEDEEEDILILEPDPDWNGEEEDLED